MNIAAGGNSGISLFSPQRVKGQINMTEIQEYCLLSQVEGGYFRFTA